jgi:acetylornithine deacetylase
MKKRIILTSIATFLITVSSINLYPTISLARIHDSQTEQKTDTPAIKKLFDTIDRNKENHVAFFQELIRAQKGGEKSIQDFVAKRFEKMGGTVETVKFLPKDIRLKREFAAGETLRPEEGTNIVGTFPGTGEGRSLLVFAHHDVFPMPAELDWTHDPVAGDIDGNKIIGWGTADDFGGIAIMAEAMNAIRLAGLRPGGDVYLCSVVSKSNSRGVVAVLERGYHADASIYLHPAESGVGLREIQSVSSGVLRFRITVTGQRPVTTEPGDAPFAHRGVNAIDKGFIVIQALKKLDEQRGRRVYHKAIDDKVGRSTNLLIGKIGTGSGKSFSQVPTEFTIGANLVFPPNESLEKVRQEVEEAVSRIAETDPWLKEHPPVIDWLIGADATEVSYQHPIYLTVSNAIQTVTGIEPFVNPLHSLNDIRNPLLYSGIPTVGFGPFSGYGVKDEWVDVEDYIRAIKVAAQTIYEWTR